MPITDKIKELITPDVEAHSAFVVSIEILGPKEGKTVQISLDTDAGITSEKCAEISRSIAKLIDAENLFPSKYNLEVSSPGLDRPLKFPRQYPRNIGRKLRLTLAQGSGRKKVHGTLKRVNDDGIEIASEDGELEQIPFNVITEGIVDLPW